MITQPLITIGIPVYNEEKYLAKTIESVINQTYKKIKTIELIKNQLKKTK